MSKNLIFGSAGAAGFVALLAILDLTLKFPFGGYSKATDILFLVAAAIVVYLGWDSYRDT